MIDATVRKLVIERAGNCCEYCGLPQKLVPLITFHVEHIVARQHSGTDEPDNLAFACFHCNLHKGPNLAGVDPETGKIVVLFNPRFNLWANHFAHVGSYVLGKTATGRATVQVLAMNADDLRLLRSEAG